MTKSQNSCAFFIHQPQPPYSFASSRDPSNMSDPFSVAGTAVGIASLGIQVCQGFVSYLQSIEGRKQQITDGLREIQALIPILYSLNNLLSSIDRQRGTELFALQECLRDSEKKLLELQQLLITLRGPESSLTSKGKMKETARSLIYPFREESLIALRMTVHNPFSKCPQANDDFRKSEISHHDHMETIEASTQRLEVESKNQSDRMRDMNNQMEKNLDQLRSMDRSVNDALDAIKRQLTGTEWRLQDFGQNISGKLTLIEADTSSIASRSLITAERMIEMMDKLDSHSALMSTLNMSISRINHDESQSCMRLRPRPFDQLPTPSFRNDSSSRTLSTASRATQEGCGCGKEIRWSSFSFAFGNVKFQFDQDSPWQHTRGCKLYGIARKTKRNIKAQFPVSLAWLSTRITLACIDYKIGTSSPGVSVRYRNVVPMSQSPFFEELEIFENSIRLSRSSNEAIGEIESFERAILSLYREQRTLPSDRDERGRSHTVMLMDIVTYPTVAGILCSDSSVLSALLPLLQTMIQIVSADDESVNMSKALFAVLSFLPVGGQDVGMNRRKLISFLASSFHFKADGIFSRALYHNLIPDMSTLPDVVHACTDKPALAIQGPPITRALLLQSVNALEKCISSNPQAPMETVEGYSTLHISATWPERLKRLLATEARKFINDCFKLNGSHTRCISPIMRAMRGGCAESVDLLLRAGCRVDLDENLVLPLRDTSRECVSLIAERLFQMRRELLELARPANLCKALDAAYVFVPPALRVPWHYKTIYHYPGLRIDHFRIFFDRGFQVCNAHNHMGLTPIMVWRPKTFLLDYMNFRHDCLDGNEALAIFSWIKEQGFLSETPTDPLNLRLNTHATGWHYLASMLGSGVTKYAAEAIVTPLAYEMMKQLPSALVRDNCACWCNPDGKGCSAFKSLLKAHADSSGIGRLPFMEATALFFRHCFFHRNDPNIDIKLREPSGLFVELVRLLTFEALDMRHTCCVLKRVGPEKICSIVFPSTKWDDEDFPGNRFDNHETPFAIVDRDPEEVQEIRSDEREQREARQLDALMTEFTSQMGKTGSSPEGFIWGYWRRRISELFAVNDDAVGDMKRYVGAVKTYVLPKRVRCFLGDRFDLLREAKKGIQGHNENENNGGKALIEGIDPSQPGRYCDHGDGIQAQLEARVMETSLFARKWKREHQ
ncbi:hypothetical protein B0T10DRAFT_552429 [Thelonectria olida]|uniref:Fungal N-terminal domain-containing protein n=1 Tax=Thelonectria olida TaxID=1576542 RepID=A0A9P8VTZ0_9HYPO|nr:hypothetical protein B0T10DRAFT_552429 [Thelonectria olida]